jgi:hypothetical protein
MAVLASWPAALLNGPRLSWMRQWHHTRVRQAELNDQGGCGSSDPHASVACGPSAACGGGGGVNFSVCPRLFAPKV